MHLTLDALSAYLRLRQPNTTEDDHAAAVARLRERVERGERDLSDTLIIPDPARGPHALLAAARVYPSSDTELQVYPPAVRHDLAPEDAKAALEALADALVAHLDGLTGCRASTRLILPIAHDVWPQRLEAMGFVRHPGTRVEFDAQVADLPGDDGSPFDRWEGMDTLGLDAVADVLERAAAGDPSWDPDKDKARELLPEYLQDPDLTCDPHYAQVGFLNGEPVAFTMVQMDPNDGWSRITYMGLAPEARGRGLGAWVHRRGFALMKTLGGVRYHGGTHSDNVPMRRLFERHGCKLLREMIEWNRPAPSPTS